MNAFSPKEQLRAADWPLECDWGLVIEGRVLWARHAEAFGPLVARIHSGVLTSPPLFSR
jgi:hypothetical protein